ncbi:aminopeptidase P family N-terminal domain-containing protein [Paenibacillus puerhi]|uniref:aminopeptidase P family N-terminal domain-containing protein n=1 Tax=Paenibacillus puerhi TaxID=2692622 RepID=UPI00135837A1|nr:aminopeptidase P family N-terminal domain-containing protein [Paenibacillus puerhi]
MKITWREMKLPDFGIPEEVPVIPAEIYEERCRKAYAAANCDWFVVYGDREHFANMHYLTGFDPRFEEALLLIGPNGHKYLLVGNEGIEYASLAKPQLSAVLCQSFSLMGQDRTRSPRLDEIMREVGVARGQSIGLCGWKYMEQSETNGYDGLHVPAMLVNCVASVIGGKEGIKDVTHVLIHPVNGLRAYSEAEQIAVNEWAAARASAALMRIVQGTRPGVSELEAVSRMQYAGEPLSAHIMYASGKDDIVGLRSPSARKVEQGDGVFSAVGYWGGLSARGGLAAADDASFIADWAVPYYRGIAAWYSTTAIGSSGGDVYARVCDELRLGDMKPALNPGHLIGSDEWVHSFFTPGNETKVASGMAIQCDIIPAPMPEGIVLNCEDSVVFADESLRSELQGKYPEVWARIQARQRFVREEIGISISDDLLPLSNTPAYYAPLFLSPGRALAIS